MLSNSKVLRNYDAGLVLIAAVTVMSSILLSFIFTPQHSVAPLYSQLMYTTEEGESLSFDTVTHLNTDKWKPVSSPVNLGINTSVHWFSFVVPPTQSDSFLLHIDYSLLDYIDVGIYSHIGSKPTVQYSAGDAQVLSHRPIVHTKPLFPLPSSAESQRVIVRVQTSGAVRLPVRIWEEKAFFTFSASHNLMLGLFFGVLLAMGVSNAFLTVTSRNHSFMLYSGYVLSLALTLATLNGFGFTYLWAGSTWFQSKAIIIFANATIMFAALFTRSLMSVKEHSVLLDKITIVASGLCALSILFGLALPYNFMIKAHLLLLSFIIVYTLGLGVWLSIKRLEVARYFTVAWAFLLISGLSAILDTLNLIELPISSNNLLIVSGAVETLILALILSISYSHSRDDLIEAQQFALEQEKQANTAKENLLSVQQRYQDDLEYKVQERTLELEITLRELSDVNQELERLNAIDPLTGVHNRRHFDKRLRNEGRRSRREQTPLSLAIIDVDYFKRINDKYGHDGGDACLIHVTQVFQKLIQRPTDDLCRIGGEEFAVILPNTDLNGAYHVAENIRLSLQQSPIIYDGESIQLTVSAGVATTIIQNEEHAQALFRYADELLYQAKSAGRNTVIHQNLQDKS